MGNYTFHPAAADYPLMGDRDLEELVRSIKDNGQQVPAVAVGTQIIDGRNRYRACQVLGIDCLVTPYVGDEADIPAAVEALNEHRRHLTQKWLEAKRKERVARVAEARKEGKSLHTIAAEEGVSHQQVKRDLDKAATLTGVKVEPDDGKVKGDDGRARDTSKIGKGRKKKEDAPPPAPASDPDDVEFDPPAPAPCRTADPPPVRPASADATPRLDAWGIPVQPHAEAAFAPEVLAEFRRVAGLLREAQKSLTALAESPGGAHLVRRCQWVKSNSKAGGRWVLAALDNALREIEDARPAVTDCPYAHNEDRGHEGRCPLCAGVRWLGSPKGHQIPPTLTKAMLAHYGVEVRKEAGA